MPVSISWNATFRNRVRLLAGIEQEELDNDTLDNGNITTGDGYVVTDRNSLLEKLKRIDESWAKKCRKVDKKLKQPIIR